MHFDFQFRKYFNEIAEFAEKIIIEREMKQKKEYRILNENIRETSEKLIIMIDSVKDESLRDMLQDCFSEYEEAESSRCAYVVEHTLENALKLGYCLGEIEKKFLNLI